MTNGHTRVIIINDNDESRPKETSKVLDGSPDEFRRIVSRLWQDQVRALPGKLLSGDEGFISRKPYLTSEMRAALLEGARFPLQLDADLLKRPVPVHVDFSLDEFRRLRILTRRTLNLDLQKGSKDPRKDLMKVLRVNQQYVPVVVKAIAKTRRLPGRTESDLANLFQDLVAYGPRPKPETLKIERDHDDQRGDFVRSSRLNSLLFAREIWGQRGFVTMRTLENFNNDFRKCREDELERRAYWLGCAGDVVTISWVSNNSFICGTTDHSDSHNQQYNKPGNLVFGSCDSWTLQAYPDHRIVRPIVNDGENSTEDMVQSQSPWLYTSVVSSDFDHLHGLAFTSGFDRMVKIWRIDKAGTSMMVVGEWRHDGNVNFVVASKHPAGLVATAADVVADAVRIYTIDQDNISMSPFRSFSCSRVTDPDGSVVSTEKWAYFPATMQWGLEESVKHLLLVGYSPRSLTGNDMDIPEDRQKSGELCLWDGLTGKRWRITSATTQNVFEVLWHPTQPWFVAATTPLGLDVDPGVRTQIRIFRPIDLQDAGGPAFSPIWTLDCRALDINELTIMPNSTIFCYITAGCTDGCTYVWDTGQKSNRPIRILRHGDPVDEVPGDREKEDIGVKFTAWGTTLDRFYTASSDGVLKVWNIRSENNPHVRDLLRAPAAITAGMFSPDKSRLIIGDASGRVHLLSVNEQDERPATVLKLPGSDIVRIRQPTITLHPEPPPPTYDARGRPILSHSGVEIGRAYLENEYLERHPDPTIGVVQGPRYAKTGLFRREAHFLEDPSQPLLAHFEVHQQEANKGFSGRRREQFLSLRPVKEVEGLREKHARNKAMNFDINALDEETITGLLCEGADLELGEDYVLEYESE